MSSSHPYHEKLLHWIWEHCYFDLQQLQTTGGDSVQLYNPGQLNKSDGPDFQGAEIFIGSLRWYGDVEIHWNLRDWKAHDHHKDPNFNNVILHVVFEETNRQSIREDETTIPTLCLSSCLSEPLQKFLDQYHSQVKLPCAGQLSFISEEAFANQLDKAHKEYFEQKVNDLLEFYDPSLVPSKAWTKMLVIALFDGLGISHNRAPMQRLATKLFTELANINSPEQLRQKALELSRIDKEYSSQLSWKHKGCRPGNHPRARILQGADMLWHIIELPFAQWIQNDFSNLWQDLTASVSTKPSLGHERASILFGTVFLPAMYSLGNLFFSEKLKSQSWRLWQAHKAPIPPSLLKQFSNTEIPASIYNKKLGSIYQLRSYCRPRNCQECEVFKSAIYP